MNILPLPTPKKALFTSITPKVFNQSRLCGKLCILYTRTWSQRTVTNGAQTYLYKTINWTMYRLRRLPASVCVYNALQSVTLNQQVHTSTLERQIMMTSLVSLSLMFLCLGVTSGQVFRFGSCPDVPVQADFDVDRVSDLTFFGYSYLIYWF